MKYFTLLTIPLLCLFSSYSAATNLNICPYVAENAGTTITLQQLATHCPKVAGDLLKTRTELSLNSPIALRSPSSKGTCNVNGDCPSGQVCCVLCMDGCQGYCLSNCEIKKK